MLAFQMKGRKIMFQWKGKEEVIKCFVDDFEVEDEKAVFSFTSITGKKFKAKDGQFNWQDAEEEVEREARKAYKGLVEFQKMYSGLDDETYGKIKEIMGEDMLKSGGEVFEKRKAELIAYRIEKSKVHRQYYHEGKLHVFYDIHHGNNVDNFMTMEEIEKMKEDFAKADWHNHYKPKKLNSLQAFDENYNLVLDEWEVNE